MARHATAAASSAHDRSSLPSPELDAYNAAFHELGLDWHWDAATWATLEDIEGERERVCAYLRAHHPHLLKVYDAEFLGAALVELKARQAATAAHLARAANEPRH